MRLLLALGLTSLVGCTVYDVEGLGSGGGGVDAATMDALDVTRAGAGGADSGGGRAGAGGASGQGGSAAQSGGRGGGSAGIGGVGGNGGAAGNGGSGGLGLAGGGGSDAGVTMPDASGSVDGATDASRGPPRHAFVESGGEFSIEAEHFVASLPGTGRATGLAWENATAQVDTSGSYEQALPKIGVNTADTLEGPELEYDLRFTGTGTYYVWVRIFASNNQSDSVHVGWDDGPPLTYGGQGIGANSATWVWRGDVAGFLAGDGGNVRVKVDVSDRGYHTLRIYMREDGVALDKIVVTRDVAAPTGTGPRESFRE